MDLADDFWGNFWVNFSSDFLDAFALDTLNTAFTQQALELEHFRSCFLYEPAFLNDIQIMIADDRKKMFRINAFALK